MTTEEKAKAYDEAIIQLRTMMPNWEKLSYNGKTFLQDLVYIIPELKESEGEKIIKSITRLVKAFYDVNFPTPEGFERKDIIAWLEKQGGKDEEILILKDQIESLHAAIKAIKETHRIELEKQGEQKPKHFELKAGHWYICHRAYCCRADHLTVKEGERFMCEKDGVVKGFVIKEAEKYFKESCAPAPMEDEQKPADKAEPKFKVGDCIVNSQGTLRHIINVDKGGYQTDKGWLSHDTYEKAFHLWSIQDAKAGDVLADGNLPFIFKKIDTNKYSYAYCGISVDDGFKIDSDGESGEWTWMQDIKPATKEQRDLLFQKMHEAGYEWNADKKELKKIEQKPTWKPSNEQMKALADALSLAKNCGEEIAFDLRTLLEQLKAL